MSGEMDLGQLIRSMNAELRDGVFVFATTKDQAKVQAVSALMVFQEAEGTTLVLERAEAEKHDIEYEFPCRMITLNVHSALEGGRVYCADCNPSDQYRDGGKPSFWVLP